LHRPYLKAKELGDSIAWTNAEIGICYKGLGKYEEGLKYLERLEKLGQDDAWTNTEYGYCLSKLKRFEEAI